MHILIVASYGPSLITFRGPLIRELATRGHKISVASPDCSVNSQSYLRLRSLGVATHEIPLSRTGTSPFGDLKTFLHIFRLVRKTRPDIVLSYTIKPVIYASIAAWLAGVNRRYVLVTGLGFNFTESRDGAVTHLVRWLYKFALGKVNKVFFQNPDDKASFEDMRVVSPATSSVVVNGSGIDVGAFKDKPLPSGDIVFLMIARLLGDKGVREYAEAAARIREIFPNARFHLAGWIDEHPNAISRQELESWIENGTIEFLGYLDDVRPEIEAATVYVLPSYYREGTPRTVLEAMAMGRPIITTDAPGCRETVVDGYNGFLIPVKSVSGLVEAMQRFIENPDLAAEMGKRSREVAEDKYDVRKVNDVMLREMGIC